MTASIVDIKDHGGNFGFNVFCHKEIRIYVPKKMFYLGRCLDLPLVLLELTCLITLFERKLQVLEFLINFFPLKM